MREHGQPGGSTDDYEHKLRTVKLRQLEVFHAIMTAGSVTGAAVLLHVSQPAVTSQLRYLESQLGFKLFDRIKGRLFPTDEAQSLAAEVDRVFESVRAVRNLAVDLRDTRRGVLSVVTSPSLGVTVIPKLVSRFLAARPGVRVRLQVHRKAEVIEMIARQLADIGVTYLSTDHPSVAVDELARADLVCAIPAGHPLAAHGALSAADLAGQPIITYTHAQGLSALVDSAFAEAKVTPRRVAEVGLVSTAWSFVQEGLGIALVDPFSGLGTVFGGVVTRPFSPAQRIALEMLHPVGKSMSVLAESFAAELRSGFGEIASG